MNDFQVLIDFYNLHLNIDGIQDIEEHIRKIQHFEDPYFDPDSYEELVYNCRKCKIFKYAHKGIFQNTEKRQKVIEFLRAYEPSITEYLNAASYLDRVISPLFTTPDGEVEEQIKKMMREKTTIPDKTSLGSYQYHELTLEASGSEEFGWVQQYKEFNEARQDRESVEFKHPAFAIEQIMYNSGNLQAYIEKHKNECSWFDSDQFHAFLREYCYTVKPIIDEYLNGVISSFHLWWINKKLNDYRSKWVITKQPENATKTDIESKVDREDFLSLKDTKFYRKMSPELGDYDVPLYSIMYLIYHGLANMLTERPIIKRCAFDGSALLPGCENIYIPMKSNQLYCSKKCYDKARRRRRYEKVGE